MKVKELDTPTLLIDREILTANLKRMADYAQRHQVRLRPHTKTHKMPAIARMQMDLGANGIAVAKIGEAEVMQAHGLDDIFIANEIVGPSKLNRIADLDRVCRISFGVDSVYGIQEAEQVFGTRGQNARVLIEVEVGEQRCGVNTDEECEILLDALARCSHVTLLGVFGHDGNTYNVEDLAACEAISAGAQKKLVHFARLIQARGFEISVVSYGSTPPLVHQVPIEPGITELRPGTYALMDVSQGYAQGTLAQCAATVLASVVSKPTPERVILDVGAKGITMQERTVGICSSRGKGVIKEFPEVSIQRVFDEHAIIQNAAFHDAVQVGDKLQIIPVHICPVCNLYDHATLISGNDVIEELEISCRGKLQ